MEKLVHTISFVFFIFFSLSPNSWAATNATFSRCTPANQIKEYVFDCDHNIYFSQQSESCEKNFQTLIERESKALRRVLTKKVALGIGTHGSQKLAVDNTDASLIENDHRLQQLIHTGVGIEAELQRYLRSLRWPVTWDKSEPYPDYNTAAAYFEDEACFGQNRKRIAKRINEVQQMLSELRTVKKEGRRLDHTVSLNGEQLESVNEKVRTFQRMPAREGAKVPRSQTKNSHSTITSRKDHRK